MSPQDAPDMSTTPAGWGTPKVQKDDNDAGTSKGHERKTVGPSPRPNPWVAPRSAEGKPPPSGQGPCSFNTNPANGQGARQ